MIFAFAGQPQYLPKQQPTAGQTFSVPTLDGRYAYYVSDQPTPPRNDDFPLPISAHPNKIGIASTAIGREMPRNARFTGTGDQAIGSVTAMPGQSAPLGRGQMRASGPSADGLGLDPGVAVAAVGWVGVAAFVVAGIAGWVLVHRESKR